MSSYHFTCVSLINIYLKPRKKSASSKNPGIKNPTPRDLAKRKFFFCCLELCQLFGATLWDWGSGIFPGFINFNSRDWEFPRIFYWGFFGIQNPKSHPEYWRFYLWILRDFSVLEIPNRDPRVSPKIPSQSHLCWIAIKFWRDQKKTP